MVDCTCNLQYHSGYVPGGGLSPPPRPAPCNTVERACILPCVSARQISNEFAMSLKKRSGGFARRASGFSLSYRMRRLRFVWGGKGQDSLYCFRVFRFFRFFRFFSASSDFLDFEGQATARALGHIQNSQGAIIDGLGIHMCI